MFLNKAIRKTNVYLWPAVKLLEAPIPENSILVVNINAKLFCIKRKINAATCMTIFLLIRINLIIYKMKLINISWMSLKYLILNLTRFEYFLQHSCYKLMCWNFYFVLINTDVMDGILINSHHLELLRIPKFSFLLRLSS